MEEEGEEGMKGVSFGGGVFERGKGFLGRGGSFARGTGFLGGGRMKRGYRLGSRKVS